jgi:hypothetical protein
MVLTTVYRKYFSLGPQPCIIFHNKLDFYGGELLAPCPTPKLEEITPCELSMTAYSIHSQLPSIYGGHLFHSLGEGM